MKWRRVVAVARKEALQVVRDPRSLMIALLLPLMQMFLLGYGVKLDVKHIPLCVVDQEGSQRSQDLLKRFAASRYFEIEEVDTLAARAGRRIDDGSCRLAVVVPAQFSRGLDDLHSATVQVLVDGTDSNTATIAAGYAQGVIGAWSREVQVQALQRSGLPTHALTPLELRPRVWFNEDLESSYFIIPGVVALVMSVIGAQLTSLTIAREWERGTMELLVSTPVTPLELMIGKLSPYFAVGLLDAAICLAVAVGWFEVPFRGALATLFGTSSLFLAVVLSIGYLISVGIRSQVGASQIALVVTMLPTTLLSGFTFPIDQMPKFVQGVTYLVSARYYVTILKSIFLKGSSAQELLLPIACLALYAAVIVVLAARAFRKTLD
ncbi:MAG: ABC transporter permease [Betaproteobacteria bacterium]